MQIHSIAPHLSLIFVFFLSFLNVDFVTGLPAGESPFTPKASLIRYWSKEIRNDLPKSDFLLSKSSPLSAVDAAAFTKLASQNVLSTRLPAFCSAAKLFCFPDLSPSLEKHTKDSNFAVYQDRNFTNYGTARAGGLDSFKNYSDDGNVVADSFRRYGRDAAGHGEKFTGYAREGNAVDQTFNTYGAGATGGTGEFRSYNDQVNVPNLKFNNYGDDATGKSHNFATYTKDTNSGNEEFRSYGKHGNGAPNEFAGYGENSNVIGSNFVNYGEDGNGANDTFTSYGDNGNNPQNTFRNYGDTGNSAVENFNSYRDQSNVGDDSFDSYGKDSNAAEVNFGNYGKSFNDGSSTFSGYGKGGTNPLVGFKTYGANTTFKDYAKTGVTFSGLSNQSSSHAENAESKVSGSSVNKWVEPGKFFRESMLKKGTVMPMPDMADKMPRRSFLPRTITSKLPFSTSKLAQVKEIFHASENSTMERVIQDALKDCERVPSPGETKRCVGSVEDMIDFATSVLGRNVAVRTTANVYGSKEEITVGDVTGINGGEITKSVSCHQSLYPYLLYYCHSVPKVRVYEADILDSKTRARINHGVAICHIDTSSWSPTHGAFLALGSGPGQIEVCHWIFQNDMTWTIADN